MTSGNRLHVTVDLLLFSASRRKFLLIFMKHMVEYFSD